MGPGSCSTGRSISRSAVHDTARLRSPGLPARRGGEHLGGSLYWRAHHDALRLLASHPCHPSRDIREPGPSRSGGHRDADGGRVSRALAPQAPWLPTVSPPARDAGTGAALHVPHTASIADRSNAGEVGLEKRLGQQPRTCSVGGDPCPVRGGARDADRAPSGRVARRRHRGGTVLCAAPVRGQSLDASGRVEPHGLGAGGKLAPRSSAAPALADGEHWRAPPSPRVQPHPILPPAQSDGGTPIAGDRLPSSHPRPGTSAQPGALGRDRRQDGDVS